jgi:hypothetical protein
MTIVVAEPLLVAKYFTSQHLGGQSKSGVVFGGSEDREACSKERGHSGSEGRPELRCVRD